MVVVGTADIMCSIANLYYMFVPLLDHCSNTKQGRTRIAIGGLHSGKPMPTSNSVAILYGNSTINHLVPRAGEKKTTTIE